MAPAEGDGADGECRQTSGGDAAQNPRKILGEAEPAPQGRLVGNGAEGEEADIGRQGDDGGDGADLDERELLVEEPRPPLKGGAAEEHHDEAAQPRQGEAQIGAAQHRQHDRKAEQGRGREPGGGEAPQEPARQEHERDAGDRA
jgi:hypothetical protein